MINKLIDLQNKVYEYYNSLEYGFNLEYSSRISFSKIGEGYEINFYGEGYDDDPRLPSSEFDIEDEYNYVFCTLLDFLAENGESVVSLNFDGPDTGANGMRRWDFTRLAQSDVVFNNLKSFRVALTDVGHHNLSTISESEEDDANMIRLMAKMPNLEKLELPSALNKDFFNLPDLKIVKLRIQAGIDHLNFIKNLSQSKNLPHLKDLDFTDVLEEDDEFEKTPFEAYKNLFQSNLFTYKSSYFTLRENKLTEEELSELQKIRRIQFLHIKAIPSKYIK